MEFNVQITDVASWGPGSFLPSSVTISNPNPDGSPWVYVQPQGQALKITANVIQDMCDQLSKQSLAPDTIQLSMEQYEALTKAEWGAEWDNEGAMNKQLWMAKKDREDELKMKGQMAAMEIDPIQDREV